MAIPISKGVSALDASDHPAVARVGYRPDVDGLRAIAALSVVGDHIGVLPGGFVGVDIFFVISGYLISGLILRALVRGTFSTVEFYARRVKRIFPALLTILLAASVLGWLTLLASEYRRLGKEIITGAGFFYNLAGYWDTEFDWHGSWSGVSLGHLWSLGVEEQFYLLWPFFLMSIWRFKKRHLASITGITAVSFVISAMMVLRGMNAYPLPWTRLWQLSLGGTVAYVELCRINDFQRLPAASSTVSLCRLGLCNSHVLGLIGTAMLVASCICLKDPSSFPGWQALAPSVGAILVIAAGPTGWINRNVLSVTPLVTTGLISYPIYLWHVILLQISHLIAPHVTPIVTGSAVIVTFILSFITYKYVELPIRRSKNTTAVTGVLCTMMLACGSLGYLISRGIISERPQPLDARNFVRASTEDWLPDTVGTSWTRGASAFITVGSGARSVLYIGDSNMQQYYRRIKQVLADHPLNSHGAVFAARDWCAPIESDIPGSHGATSPECVAFVHRAFNYAKGESVDTVVISACWRCYFFSLENPRFPSGEVNTGVETALGLLQLEIEDLVLAGKHVYIILGIPVSVDMDPRTMIHRSILPPGFRVVIHSPKRSEFTAAIEPITSRLAKIAQAAGAKVIDPMQSLCNETTCSPVSAAGAPVYHDWFNLSPSYVRENVRYLDITVLDP